MMDTVIDSTLHDIRRAVETTMGRKIEITADTDIARDLEIDSLALMNIVMELEDRFDLSMPLDRLSQVETAGDLARVVDDLRSR